MEVTFHLVKIGGEEITNMEEYYDAIFDILAGCTDEDDEVSVGTGWFSLWRMPTIREILAIECKLVELGLVIKA